MSRASASLVSLIALLAGVAAFVTTMATRALPEDPSRDPTLRQSRVLHLSEADKAWLETIKGRTKGEVVGRFGYPDHVGQEEGGFECWWYRADDWWKGVAFSNGVARGQCFTLQTGIAAGPIPPAEASASPDEVLQPTGPAVRRSEVESLPSRPGDSTLR